MFNALTLYIKNKFTEIGNVIYAFWNDGLAGCYVAIFLCAAIPGILISYLITWGVFHESKAIYDILMLSFMQYVGIFVGLSSIHFIMYSLYKWIKQDFNKAVLGIKVHADWKKKTGIK